MTVVAAAVDLGATSGRVLVGRVGADRLDLTEVARFPNVAREVDGVLRWDFGALWSSIGAGIRSAVVDHGATMVGIDSWAVDYGLIGADGRQLGDPACYRDGRTDGVVDRVSAGVSRAEHYAISGLQYQPFNSVYQLLAEPSAVLQAARRMLMLPDLLVYLLTGVEAAERTNASTTGLYDATTGSWPVELCQRLGVSSDLLAPLVDAGSAAGLLQPSVLAEWGLPADSQVGVVRVGSHDTASAVAAVPAENDRFAYVSCGTWSLVGLELDAPVLTDAARDANFTNEVGVDSTIRFLRNVTGLWLLSESLQAWTDAGLDVDRDGLLAAAAELPAGRWLIDAESAEFLAPGDMPARIQAAAARRGDVPTEPVEIVRCIIDSLAAAHASNVELACRLANREVDVVHIVGGGSAIGLLCQATADACELPVVAGPIEATAIGNLLVQVGSPNARTLVRETQHLTRYEPTRR